MSDDGMPIFDLHQSNFAIRKFVFKKMKIMSRADFANTDDSGSNPQVDGEAHPDIVVSICKVFPLIIFFFLKINLLMAKLLSCKSMINMS